MAEQLMSQRDFAKLMGYSEGAVRKWILKKRITGKSIDLTTGKAMILVESAKRELADTMGGKMEAVNTDPSKRFKTRGQRKEVVESVYDSFSIDDNDEVPIPAIGAGFEEYMGLTVTRLNQIRLVRDIQMADVKIGEASKRLVLKEQVYAALFEVGQELRDALLAVPDRVVDDMLVAKSRNEAYDILSQEIHSVLTRLSDADRKLP